MSYKQFRTLRIIMATIIATTVSTAVVTNSYMLALAVVVIAAAVVFVARSRVRGIIADERDYTNAGNAARWSIAILAPLGAIMSGIFIYLRDYGPMYQTIGSTLAYSVCVLMLAHSGIYTYLNRKNKTDEKSH